MTHKKDECCVTQKEGDDDACDKSKVGIMTWMREG
jgi:hypothetical protein